MGNTQSSPAAAGAHTDVEVHCHGKRKGGDAPRVIVPDGMCVVLVCSDICATSVDDGNATYMDWMASEPTDWMASLDSFAAVLGAKATLPPATGWCVFEPKSSLPNISLHSSVYKGQRPDVRLGLLRRPLILQLRGDELDLKLRGATLLLPFVARKAEVYGDRILDLMPSLADRGVLWDKEYRVTAVNASFVPMGPEVSDLAGLLEELRPASGNTVNVYLYVCFGVLLNDHPGAHPLREMTADTTEPPSKRPRIVD